MNVNPLPGSQSIFVDGISPRQAIDLTPAAPALAGPQDTASLSAPSARREKAVALPSPVAPSPVAAPAVTGGSPAPVAEIAVSVTTSAPEFNLRGPLMATDEPAAPPPRLVLANGYDPGNLDRTVRPQDNFHQYAVGNYLKTHPIPDDKASWGVDAELTQRIQGTLRDILDGLPADAPRGSNEQKLRDFFRGGMDQARIDAAGLTPLQPEFDRIAAIRDLAGVQDEVARLHATGLGSMFGFGAEVDAGDPGMIIGGAYQGGLAMPNREYYLSDDPQKKKVRDAYCEHVGKMFELAGDPPALARAEALQVLALETHLAAGCLTPEQMRDPQALYNPMDRAQLAELTPHLDWSRYFAGIGQPDIERINVGMPGFFKQLDEGLEKFPVGQWKTYLKWQTLHHMAPYLSHDVEQESFNFTGKVLTGVTAQTDRWKRMVHVTDDYLGEALGQKFVEGNFSPQAKAKALEMVDNIKAAVRDKINHGWMSDESRKGALEKVDTLVAKIGYPDKWTDYSTLDIQDRPFAENVLAANAFLSKKNLDTIGKPVDRTTWEMSPSTVNAYYQPTRNEIVFPAAILQPPYFDVKADDAANYGATGATIGHELTHAFDDEGSQFDATGALRTWMAPDDQARFKERAEGVARQFDEFTYDGQKCNGRLVEGEAIADLGGLEIAWAAFQKASEGRPEPKTDDGFTPQQRFFLNYALSWATSMRPEKAHLLMSNDPHPLPHFRVLGPLANMPEFHQAFAVRPGDPMMRPDDLRCKLWNP